MILRNFCENELKFFKLIWFHGILPKMEKSVAHWKKEKFSLTKKSFREINALVLNFFRKSVDFTKFYQYCVRVNFRIFHTVCWAYYILWILRNSNVTISIQKFREIVCVTIWLYRKLISQNIFNLRTAYMVFPQCDVWSWYFSLYVKCTPKIWITFLISRKFITALFIIY